MTCWHLRNMLFPLLWEYVEGCNLFGPRPSHRRHAGMVLLQNGLYAQCSYLIRNPTICAYVQAFSVDLRFQGASKDLMTIFIDCLVRLPNLRTLDIFSTSDIGPMKQGFERECARFPGIRELWIGDVLGTLVGSCPNVESVTVVGGLSWDVGVLCSQAKKLKRIAGVDKLHLLWIVGVCPDIQEISIDDTIGNAHISVVDLKLVEHLRILRHLAVVDLDLSTPPFYPDETDTTAESEHYRGRVEADLNAWKAYMIEVLKDSHSNERKFLRWKVYKIPRRNDIPRGLQVIAEEGVLEVFPETSL